MSAPIMALLGTRRPLLAARSAPLEARRLPYPSSFIAADGGESMLPGKPCCC